MIYMFTVLFAVLLAPDSRLACARHAADVNLAIQATNERIATAQKKRKKFADEAEFYKKKALPPELEKDLRAIDHEIRLQQELIALKQKEFDTIKAKYDADRKRYFELTRKSPTTPPGGAVSQPR
jgi:Na+-translocating ferredoxin:NAD+ oxidoreductase RnfC subunit